MVSVVKSIPGFVLLLFVLMTLSQCATANREAAPALPDLKTGKISDQIERLEAVANSPAEPSVRARAHLRLADIYSSHDNPRPNYRQALKELETYLSLDPAGGATDEMRNRLVLLREVVKESEENRKQKQTINQLTRENRELKDTLEELKNLDIRMEEKRKQVR